MTCDGQPCVDDESTVRSCRCKPEDKSGEACEQRTAASYLARSDEMVVEQAMSVVNEVCMYCYVCSARVQYQWRWGGVVTVCSDATCAAVRDRERGARLRSV